MLAVLMSGLGSIGLRILGAMLSRSVLEFIVMKFLDISVSRYAKSAKADPEIAKALEDLVAQVEAQLQAAKAPAAPVASEK